MTDEELRVWIAFALLDGIAAWNEINSRQQFKLEDLGYIIVRASRKSGYNEIIVTNMGKQFLKEVQSESQSK